CAGVRSPLHQHPSPRTGPGHGRPILGNVSLKTCPWKRVDAAASARTTPGPVELRPARALYFVTWTGEPAGRDSIFCDPVSGPWRPLTPCPPTIPPWKYPPWAGGILCGRSVDRRSPARVSGSVHDGG